VPRTPPPSSSKAQSFSLSAARSQSRHEPTIVVSRNELTIIASERTTTWNRRGPGWYCRTGLSQQVSSTACKWKQYHTHTSEIYTVKPLSVVLLCTVPVQTSFIFCDPYKYDTLKTFPQLSFSHVLSFFLQCLQKQWTDILLALVYLKMFQFLRLYSTK